MGWRERDLGRGHGPRPASVGAVVARTRTALLLGRAGESLLLGGSAACATLAVLALEREAPLAESALGVGLLAAVVALSTGLAWWLEHRTTALEVARRLDRELRHQGALVTAWELEGRGQRGPMAALVRGRVLERLRLRDAMRATFPPLVLPVAAPLLSVALLVWVLELDRRGTRVQADVAALTEGLEDVLDELELSVEQGQAPGDAAAEVHFLASRARELARRRDLLSEDPERSTLELAELDADLARAARRHADDPTLRRGLAEARRWVDAARTAFGGPPSGNGPGSGAGEPAGGTTGPGTAAGDGADAAVAPAGRDGTMSGSAPDAADPVDGSGTAPGTRPAVEEGPSARSAWPRAYQGIVAGWVELRQRSPAPPAPIPPE